MTTFLSLTCSLSRTVFDDTICMKIIWLNSFLFFFFCVGGRKTISRFKYSLEVLSTLQFIWLSEFNLQSLQPLLILVPLWLHFTLPNSYQTMTSAVIFCFRSRRATVLFTENNSRWSFTLRKQMLEVELKVDKKINKKESKEKRKYKITQRHQNIETWLVIETFKYAEYL